MGDGRGVQRQRNDALLPAARPSWTGPPARLFHGSLNGQAIASSHCHDIGKLSYYGSVSIAHHMQGHGNSAGMLLFENHSLQTEAAGSIAIHLVKMVKMEYVSIHLRLTTIACWTFLTWNALATYGLTVRRCRTVDESAKPRTRRARAASPTAPAAGSVCSSRDFAACRGHSCRVVSRHAHFLRQLLSHNVERLFGGRY